MSKRQKSDVEEESDSKMKKIEDEGKLTICKSPISLKDMAASQIAVLLWYHQNIRLSDKTDHFHGIICHNSHNEPYTHLSKKGFNYEYYDCDDELVNKISTFVEQLPVPPKAQDIIKSFLKPVDRQLKHWLYYHNQRIFFDYKDNSKANDVADEIIWRSNGTIDYAATALNMIHSPKLINVEKYRFMFTYCLEDHIMKESSEISSCTDDDVSFEEQPLIYYWNCSLRHTLNNIPIGDSNSVEICMLTRKHVDNWSAIEYFFDKLSFEEQIVKCIFLIKEYGIRYQVGLLSKLTDSQQHRVLMDCAKSVIINFGELPAYRKYALEVWIRCGCLITEVEFADIIDDLLKFSCQFHAGDIEHIPYLLIDIWRNASNEYRNFALNYKEHKIVNIIMFYVHYLNTDRLELLIELLSNADHSILQSIADSALFSHFCETLLERFPVHYLEKLIHLCVIGAEQSVAFKRKILNYQSTKDQLITLVLEKNISRLNCLLLVLLPYTELDEFKIQLGLDVKIINFCIDEIHDSRCEELDKFIQQFLPEQNLAVDYKKSILLNSRSIEMFCRRLECKDFYGVKIPVEILLNNEKNIESFKKKLFTYCKNFMKQRPVPYSWGAEWQKFSTWCSCDDENIPVITIN